MVSTEAMTTLLFPPRITRTTTKGINSAGFNSVSTKDLVGRDPTTGRFVSGTVELVLTHEKHVATFSSITLAASNASCTRNGTHSMIETASSPINLSNRCRCNFKT